MASVVIYTKLMCPYCVRAKELLTTKGIDYQEVAVDKDQAKFDEMLARSNGRRTVPQIFINGEHVGGCDDLIKLNGAGKLDQMLAKEH